MHSIRVESLLLTNNISHKKTSIVDKQQHSHSLSENHPQHSNVNQCDSLPIMSLHPAARLIGTLNLKREEYKKFVHLLYYGLTYCVKNLKGPSQEYLRKKSVTLPENENLSSTIPDQPKKKFLMLDLDETLIHSVFDVNLPAEVRIVSDGNEFRFNVRPHCYQFLENLANHYEIYAFTASTKDYAEPIVKYLNKNNKTIQGVLHRKNCLETVNGFKIKDLRIIKNRGLQDIILVDNLVHSFGLQLDNGIPIVEFISNKEDKELLYLEKVLMEAKQYTDVREYIREKINIRQCLEYQEKDFLNLSEKKWSLNRENAEDFEEIKARKQKAAHKQKTGLKSLLLCGA